MIVVGRKSSYTNFIRDIDMGYQENDLSVSGSSGIKRDQDL